MEKQTFTQRLLSLLLVLALLLCCVSTVAAGSQNPAPVAATNNSGGMPDEIQQSLTQAIWDESPKLQSEQADPNEIVRAIVILSSDTVYEVSGALAYSASTQSAEKQAINRDAKIQAQVEKIAGHAVVNRTTLMTNTMSVDIRRGDMASLAEIPGVETVVEAAQFKLNMISAKEIADVVSVWDDYGYDGEGVVVSVIDTGVNYLHPDMRLDDGVQTKFSKEEWEEKIAALGYGQYYSDKVPFGFNYYRNDTEIIGQNAHGSHVAGIIAANGDEAAGGIQGVAPNAQILCMSVFDYDGYGGYADDIIKALEDSIKLDADIINMSLGSAFGFYNSSYDLIEQTVNIASENGILCCVAAGNDGLASYMEEDGLSLLNHLEQKDLAVVGTPSLAEHALSVASIDNNGGMKDYLVTEEWKCEILDLADNGFSLDGDIEIVDCGLMPDFTFLGQLDGKIALIQRGGGYTFFQKAQYAAAFGAAAVIIYNNDGTDIVPSNIGFSAGESVSIPVIAVSNAAGEKIKTLGNMTNPSIETEFKPAEAPYHTSYFSSWGGEGLTIKPEISAPGGYIVSTVNGSDYASMSGTSMATPYTAGVQALILQHLRSTRPDLTGLERTQVMKALIMNTAEPLMDVDNYSPEEQVIYSVRLQGAGLLHAKDALESPVIATYKGEPKVELKEIAANTVFTITLHNFGTEPVTFTTNNGTLYTDYTDPETLEYYMQPIHSSICLKYAQKTITVPAGESVNVDVTLHITDYFQTYLPENSWVEGYVQFYGENDQTISLPLLAYYGDWDGEQIIDDPWYTGKAITTQKLGATYSTLLTYPTDVLAGYRIIEGGDEDYIAFAPGTQSSTNALTLWTTMLRNAKDVTVEILDSSGSVIRTVADIHDVSRSSLDTIAKAGSTKLSTASGTVGWDGTVYDPATGEYAVVPDGTYYMRIGARADLESGEMQYTTMKMTADTVPPVVDAAVYEDNGHFYVEFTMSDNFCMGDICGYSVNGSADDARIFWPRKNCTYDTEKNTYTLELPAKDFHRGHNEVYMAFPDMAGNYCYLNLPYDYVEKVDQITLITDFENPPVSQGKCLVEGFAPLDYRVAINGVELTLDSGYFFAYVPLDENNEASAHVEGWNALGEKVYDESFICRPDLEAPVVRFVPDPAYVEAEAFDAYNYLSNGAAAPIPVEMYISDNRGINEDIEYTKFTTYRGELFAHDEALGDLEYNSEKGCYMLYLTHNFGASYYYNFTVTDLAGNVSSGTFNIYLPGHSPSPALSITPDPTKVSTSEYLSELVGETSYTIEEYPIEFTVSIRPYAPMEWDLAVLSFYAYDADTGTSLFLDTVYLSEDMCSYDASTQTYTYRHTLNTDPGENAILQISAQAIDSNGGFSVAQLVCGGKGVGAGEAVEQLLEENGLPVRYPTDDQLALCDISFQPDNFSTLSGCTEEMLNEDGTLTITGILTGEFTDFSIDGNPIEVNAERGTWSYTLQIQPGRNRFIVLILNSEDVLVNCAYNMLYMRPAQIHVDLPETNSYGDYVVYDPTFTVQGNVEMDVNYMDIIVNGEYVHSSVELDMNNGNTPFSFETTLLPGENVVTVEIVDIFGITTTWSETILYVPVGAFRDIGQNAWYYEDVYYAAMRGWFHGVENHYFNPSGNMSRAMFATLLYRMAGEPDVFISNPFTDVPANTWYTEAVIWGYQSGIIRGTPATTFAPNAALSREQMVVLLHRYAEEYTQADLSTHADLTAYTDAAQVSAYAKEAIEWAVAVGLIYGRTADRLVPRDSVTRAEGATLLTRFEHIG